MKPREAQFLSTLHYDDYSSFERPIWLKTTAEFKFYSKVLRREITVPKDLETDGRSTPRLFWNIVPPVGPALWAAVPHDYLYQFGGYHTWGGQLVVITRAQADAVYRELMVLKGFSKPKAWVSYAMLRLFGFVAWNNHRQRQKAEVRP